MSERNAYSQTQLIVSFVQNVVFAHVCGYARIILGRMATLEFLTFSHIPNHLL